MHFMLLPLSSSYYCSSSFSPDPIIIDFISNNTYTTDTVVVVYNLLPTTPAKYTVNCELFVLLFRLFRVFFFLSPPFFAFPLQRLIWNVFGALMRVAILFFFLQLYSFSVLLWFVFSLTTSIQIDACERAYALALHQLSCFQLSVHSTHPRRQFGKKNNFFVFICLFLPFPFSRKVTKLHQFSKLNLSS